MSPVKISVGTPSILPDAFRSFLLSPFKEMPGWYLKSGQDLFLPHSFQLILY
jgi:hypothetical protein